MLIISYNSDADSASAMRSNKGDTRDDEVLNFPLCGDVVQVGSCGKLFK